MDKKRKAGRRQEADVAFHLQRGLGNEKNVHLFHDIKMVLDGQTAQIDHLILHKYGFILIESKSVYGEVSVNASHEWSRSFKNKWYGIPSPVEQANAQKEILKGVLKENVHNLLGTLLGIQKGFGGRNYDVLVAISSSAIIHRENMPSGVDSVTLKSEFLAEKVKKLIAGYGLFLGVTHPPFSNNEMEAIARFLKSKQQKPMPPNAPPTPGPSAKGSPVEKAPAANSGKKESKPKQKAEPESVERKTWVLACRGCSETEGLTGKYGRHGYYVTCSACSKNTSMKSPCPQCEGKSTRVSKRKSLYTLSCSDCGVVGTFNSGVSGFNG